MSVTNCKNCGAPLDGSGKCSYCGTVYKTDCQRIEVVQGGVRVLEAEVVTAKELVDLDPETAARYITDQLAHKFAEGIFPLLDVRAYDAPLTNSYVTRARLRVVEPDYRF